MSRAGRREKRELVQVEAYEEAGEDCESSAAADDGADCTCGNYTCSRCMVLMIILVTVLVVILLGLLGKLFLGIHHASIAVSSEYCEVSSAPLPPLFNDSLASSKEEWVQTVVQRMETKEKFVLLKGFGWTSYAEPAEGYYIGNILAVPRVGVPSINMQDAAQGFRTVSPQMIDQVTAWPCALAITAIWDPNLTWYWAAEMGEEFREKGANMILGPAVNTHRVARNGRNAEYLGGEDPYLGARLTEAYVRGMQEGAGVAAVVKHFMSNHQETKRNKVDSLIDERTMWEVYYPPFQAAVDAGVAAVMCGYNYINGRQSCESNSTLNQDLKGRMNFTGFVMSDWWALQKSGNFAAVSGTDQEQPGWGHKWSKRVLETIPPERIDDMATRIVRGMSRARSWREKPVACRVGCDCNKFLLDRNVTGEEHIQLARQLATESTVLLKNNVARAGATPGQPLLPLNRTMTVAIVGQVCSRPPSVDWQLIKWTRGSYQTVGGSGRTLSRKVVTLFQALKHESVTLQVSGSDLVNEALAVLEGADVALVCGGAESAESFDRQDLLLRQDTFVREVLAEAKILGIPTVAVTLVPGSIVAPWAVNATAFVAQFAPGQESGHALADILLGKVSPSGKLPVTFPAEESDAIQPCLHACNYSEGLNTGWHVYDGKPVGFPFGHGLSYTSFKYRVVQGWSHDQREGSWSVTLAVMNSGDAPGVEVAQLYVQRPALPGTTAGPMALKGFHRTKVLPPGQEEEIKLVLTQRDLSQWDVIAHNWAVPSGHVAAYIGSSSRDFRLCGGFGGAAISAMGPCATKEVPAVTV